MGRTRNPGSMWSIPSSRPGQAHENRQQLSSVCKHQRSSNPWSAQFPLEKIRQRLAKPARGRATSLLIAPGTLNSLWRKSARGWPSPPEAGSFVRPHSSSSERVLVADQGLWVVGQHKCMKFRRSISPGTHCANPIETSGAIRGRTRPTQSARPEAKPAEAPCQSSLRPIYSSTTEVPDALDEAPIRS